MPFTSDHPHSPLAALTRGRGGLATRLTLLAAALALAASLAGLFIDGIYSGAASTAEMFRGYDLVTAAVVVPGLAVACRSARRGSIRSQLVATGLVAYLVYTYAYYLFGTGFNDLFLLHAAVFATSGSAFVLTLTTIDVASVAHQFRPGSRVRAVAGILTILAVALGAMWIYFGVDNIITGDVPAGSRLVETDTIVHLGMALDLTLLVPLYIVAAVMLWRRARWGYVLAAVAVFAGTLHQLSYLVAMPFQAVADIPEAVSFDPGEPVILLLYLVAAAILVRAAAPESTTGVGAVTRIEGRTSFARSPEEMFDFLADPRNEPAYNPIVLSARKITPGPIGPGTRFVQRARSFHRVGEVTIDLVDWQRPGHLTWAIHSTSMDVRGYEDIASNRDGTTVHWVWDFRPRGRLRLVRPLVGLVGRRLERRVWAGMERHLNTASH